MFMTQKVYIMGTVNKSLTSSKFGVFQLGVAEDEVLKPISGAGDARSSRTALPSQTRRTGG